MSPGISIIVCTHNGRGRLAPTLSAIFTQQVNPGINWEVIIVDNASNDSTQEYCYQQAQLSGFNLQQFKVVSEDKPGLNYAREKGLRSAQYNYILFCDDDNHLFPDYIQKGADILFKNPKIGVLGGEGIPMFESKAPQWFQQYAHSYAVGPQHTHAGKIDEPAAEVYGAGSFIKAEPIINFYDRGFSTITTDRKGNSLASGGDVEWCYIAQLSGFEIWFSPDLKFYHTMPEGRLTWDYYMRLKQGISSSAALLFPYQYLLNNSQNQTSFLSAYTKYLFKHNLVFAKHLIAGSRSNEPKSALGRTIIKSKAASFRKYFRKAFEHYKMLQAFRSPHV